MKPLRVIVGAEEPLCFEHPLEVLEARNAEEADRAFDRAEELLAAGHWIAGYLAYELGEAYADMPSRGTEPLLVLGAFAEPRSFANSRTTDAQISALLAALTPQEYGDAIASLAKSIYDGDVYQVNFTVPFHAHLLGHPLAVWHRIAETTAARYQAYVEYGNRALLSWSPELFLEFGDGRIATRPMKGTAALDRTEELENAKNLAEHVMIVDLLRNDLNRICTDVRVDRLHETEFYPTFATMTSTVSGALRDVPLREVFRATFPCGSITGAPKRAAMTRIAQLERQPRNVYCGSIGYLSPERRGWWNVAIRTAQVDRKSGIARYDAGGGIVADSGTDAEWHEMLLKTVFLRNAATPFELWETLSITADDTTIARHVDRLYASARLFGATVSRKYLLDRFNEHRSTIPSLIRVRLALDGTARVLLDQLPPTTAPVRIGISSATVFSGDPFLAHKTSWRPHHDKADEEARKHGWFDALLCNERGEVTEGSRTTLFVQIGGQLFTPPLASGLLPGILRQTLIDEGRVREQPVTRAELLAADAVYVGNSARGLLQALL